MVDLITWLTDVYHATAASVTWKDMFLIILVTLVTRWVYRNLIKPFLSPLRKFPGKPYRPLIGNMFEATRAEAMTNAIRWVRELKALTIRYYHFGGEERLLSADPKVFRQLLITNVGNYERIGPSSQILRLMNKALFFLSGDEHHTVRKLLNPAFNIKILEAMFPVFESKARKVVGIWHSMLDTCTTADHVQVPVQDYMTRITLDSICATGLDYHPDSVSQPDAKDVKILGKYLRQVGRGGILGSLIPFYNKMPFKRNRNMWEEEDHISALINKTISDKREKYNSGNDISVDSNPRDLLSLLLLAKDECGNPIPEDLIFDNVTGFMFAGFDTTSITLTWLMLQLAHYPDIQQKVREEICRVIPDRTTPITHELIDKLQYMNCVIKETQRLYPVVSSTSRRALNDDVINGTHIPAGTIIVLHVGALHRSEENWKDPEKFLPERFLKEVEPYKHLPFMTGPYMCIGQKFAQFEMKIVLSCLLREFEFSLVPGYKFRRLQSLTVKPHPPLELYIRKIAV